MLSPHDQQAYARDGVLVLRGQVSRAQLTDLAHWCDDLAHTPALVTNSGVRSYYDDAARDRGERLLSRVEYLRPCHAGLASFIASPQLHAPLHAVFGEPAQLFKDKINYKLPGTAGFELHQDVQAGWLSYARDFITVMVAIDAMTPDNGCLEVAAGAHREGLLGVEWSPLTAAELRGRELRPIPAEPGDVVLLDGYTPHCSAENRTRAARRALFLSYNPQSQGDHYERYFADKLRAYPPDDRRDPGREYRYRV